MVAFGYILEGPDPQALSNLTPKIIPIILMLMEDEHKMVRSSAAWTFGRITDIIPQSIQSNHNILQPIIKCLRDDVDLVSERACWTIANLSEYYKKCNIKNNIITNNTKNFIQALLTRGSNKKSKTYLISGCFEALNAVVQLTPPNQFKMLQQLLKQLIKELTNLKNQINNMNKNDDIIGARIGGIFSGITCIMNHICDTIRKTKHTNDPMDFGLLDDNMCDNIMDASVKVLQLESPTIYEEALLSLSSVADCIGTKFFKYLGSSKVQGLLVQAIRYGEKNEILCRLGAGLIGDVFRTCEPAILTLNGGNKKAFEKFTDNIVRLFIQQLKSGDLAMETKPSIIDALSDVCLGFGGTRYTNDILNNILQLGLISLPNDAMEDEIDEFNNIRIAIMGTLRASVVLYHQAGNVNLILNNLNKILQFLDKVVNDKFTSKDVVISVFPFLQEICEYGNNNTKQRFKNPVITKYFRKANTYNDNDISLTAHRIFKSLEKN